MDGVIIALGDQPLADAGDLPGLTPDDPGARIVGSRSFEVIDGAPTHLTRYDVTFARGLGRLGRIEAVRAGRRTLAAALPSDTVLRGYERPSVQPEETAPVADSSAFALAVWLGVDDAAREEFDDWYDREHVADLLALPAWLHTCRYRRLDGSGPEFLALHYLADLDVFDEPAFRRVQETAWRARLLPRRTGHERRILRPAGG